MPKSFVLVHPFPLDAPRLQPSQVDGFGSSRLKQSRQYPSFNSQRHPRSVPPSLFASRSLPLPPLEPFPPSPPIQTASMDIQSWLDAQQSQMILPEFGIPAQPYAAATMSHSLDLGPPLSSLLSQHTAGNTMVPNPGRQPRYRPTPRTCTRRDLACIRCRIKKIRCSGDPGDGTGCTTCIEAGPGVPPCMFRRPGFICDVFEGITHSTNHGTWVSWTPVALAPLGTPRHHGDRGTWYPEQAVTGEIDAPVAEDHHGQGASIFYGSWFFDGQGWVREA